TARITKLNFNVFILIASGLIILKYERMQSEQISTTIPLFDIVAKRQNKSKIIITFLKNRFLREISNVLSEANTMIPRTMAIEVAGGVENGNANLGNRISPAPTIKPRAICPASGIEKGKKSRKGISLTGEPVLK
ncbi:MAG: hypothetical protein ACOC80_16575, partial [Petrotogales bacterium]